MFKPLYEITPYTLKLIKQITIILHDLEAKKLPKTVLFRLQEEARHLSSYSSTSIEGNPLPLTQVKKILKTKPDIIRDTEKEVLLYNEALIDLHEQVTKKTFQLSPKQIIQIHQRLMKGLLPPIKLGRFRKEAVLVNDPIKKKTIYWPPDYQDVPKLIQDLIDFCQKSADDIDPLVLGALFHKQFVLIHPFIDGNGRTTRLLTKAFLAMMGIDTFSLFSFENYYNQNVSKYFQTVGERGDFYDLKEKTNFTTWVEYFYEGILDELLRVQKIIRDQTSQKHETLATLLHADQQKIISYLETNGIIRDLDYQKLTARAKSTRVLDFNHLIQLGYIIKLGQGKGTYYKLKA